MTDRIQTSRRLQRGLAIFVSLLLFLPVLPTYLELARLGWPRLGIDYGMYIEAAKRWLIGEAFYLPHQLAGPYQVAHLDVLYPPPVLALLVPFTMLPAILWWLVPSAVIAAVVVRHRPRPVAWPFIALCIAFPPTGVKVLTGNPVMWAAAAVALGTVWGWPAVGALLKPTLAPFALFGVWRRSWWVTLALAIALAALFAPMWPDYLTAIQNAQQPSGLLYSVQEVPLMAVPILAFLARSLPARRLHEKRQRSFSPRQLSRHLRG
jgi:hypothetical protein